MPVLDVGVLRTWQYPASVVHEHTWAAESAEKFGQLTDLLFLAHVDSDMAGLAARLFNLLHGGLPCLVIAVRDDDMEAPPREASRDDHS